MYTTSSPRPAAPPDARVFVVTAPWLGCRLRVDGKPGDLGLTNRSVTAIVSRNSGWLVDFWHNEPQPPSIPQLDPDVAVDAIWVMNTVLRDNRGPFDVVADSVTGTDDAIEARTRFATGAGTVELLTTYRLDGDAPRLLIESRVTHVKGGQITHLSVGDRVKWGNVDYFVEGAGRRSFEYHGTARWVGRQGADGDLVLRTDHDRPMRVDFKRSLAGSAPEIRTAYAANAVGPDEPLLARRTLAFEPIAVPERPTVATGTLAVAVTDGRGRPLAAKLSLTGRQGTRTPDFGNEGDETGANRFVWSGTGRFSRPLPPGSYDVLATAGIERDAARFTVDIRAGETTSVSGQLPRVIETPGCIAADLHVHQVPSIDADIGLRARIIAIAAEGIELAVASDHYAITDLAPAVARLRESGVLATPLQTMIGTEVSTVGHLFGHFNVYPLQPDDFIDYEDTTPKALFAQVRQVAPKAILQVNHPRWSQVGYWHRYQLDPTARRVPARFRDEYDPSFDVVEVINGYELESEPKIRQVLSDYMHLLGQGHRYAATGNSDSHKLFFVDPGLPHNLIRYGDAASDDDDVQADPDAVVEAIRAGRVLVTSGPILDVDVDGIGPGGTVRTDRSSVRMRIRVRAASFVDVDSVEVLVGQNAGRVRYISVPDTREVVRLDTTFELRVPGNTFVVVYARGRDPLPNVFSRAIRPIAFTNPVWIERTAR